MAIADLLNSGAIPALEMTVRFAGQRQRLIAHNIANLSTPNFIPLDVQPREFQRTLREAVERRDGSTGGMRGSLEWRETAQIRRDAGGSLVLAPRQGFGNILFHDRNNRDVERLMQAHAENLAVFRASTELLRSRLQVLREAMGERV